MEKNFFSTCLAANESLVTINQLRLCLFVCWSQDLGIIFGTKSMIQMKLRLHAVMLFVINMEAITEIPETEPSSSENGDFN